MSIEDGDIFTFHVKQRQEKAKFLTETLDQTINERVKEAREGAGMTQREMATALDKTVRTVQRLENPGTSVSPGDIAIIAAATGYRKHWITTGRGEKTAERGTPSPEAARKILSMITEYQEATKDINDPEVYRMKTRLFVLGVARDLKDLVGNDPETQRQVDDMLDELIREAMTK